VRDASLVCVSHCGCIDEMGRCAWRVSVCGRGRRCARTSFIFAVDACALPGKNGRVSDVKADPGASPPGLGRSQ